jgi:cytoskeletal protein RodZ
METANFGTVLREARERRRISLAEVAQRTRVPQHSLAMIEAGNIDDLPAQVFVRGFIRSYARSVGIGDSEPLDLYEQAITARRRAAEALAATPTPVSEDEMVALAGAADDEEAPRRGLGLAVFVIIVLVIATITISLFLRQPPQSGERLSQASEPASLSPWPASSRLPSC